MIRSSFRSIRLTLVMLSSCPNAALNRCTRLDRRLQAHSGTCKAEPRNSHALSYLLVSTKLRLYNRCRSTGQDLRSRSRDRVPSPRSVFRTVGKPSIREEMPVTMDQPTHSPRSAAVWKEIYQSVVKAQATCIILTRTRWSDNGVLLLSELSAVPTYDTPHRHQQIAQPRTRV
ncbi:hypothetical protein BJX65DRAFT_58488 [Aspergillus insuetus]